MKVKNQIQEKELIEVEELIADNYTLILYNDDFNTFDHVINCLIQICKHEQLQAEQCAYLVHYTGKTDIMHGLFEELQSYKHALLEQRLSVVIQKSN
jgi:ATP-dependent Clp protease adaptor protein ClpS